MNFKFKQNDSYLDQSFLLGLANQSHDSFNKQHTPLLQKNEFEESIKFPNSVHLERISPINSVSNFKFKMEVDEKPDQKDVHSDESNQDELSNNVNNSLNFVTKLIEEDQDCDD